MPWILLFVASILEICWVYSLKQTEGFTKILPIFFYAITGAGSAYFLSLSLRSIPIGIAYTIWTGIAVIGTTLIGITLFKEPFKFLRFVYILFIIIGIIGLKISAQE